MLVTLDEMKEYLGIPPGDTAYDTFLTNQIALISETVDRYLERTINEGSYVQTYNADQFDLTSVRDNLLLYHFPTIAITEVKEYCLNEGVETTSEIIPAYEYRIEPKSGRLERVDQYGIVRNWFYKGVSQKVDVTYTAGYADADIPLPLKDVCYNLVEERYFKKTNGVSQNFGRNVQRISIPGTISIDYDYTLQANDRSSDFGMILGDYANVLDYYRSERSIQGEVRPQYVS